MTDTAKALGTVLALLWIVGGFFFWNDIRQQCRRMLHRELFSDDCTCAARFFPDAMDAACPLHGLDALLREQLDHRERAV